METRAQRTSELFKQPGGADLNALICRLPQHVVMLTGYQPILGNTFCIISQNRAQEAEVRLAVPQDEADLVPSGTAVEVQTYVEETLESVGTALESAREPLAKLVHSAKLPPDAVVGYEGADLPIAPSYTQVGIPGATALDLLRQLFPSGDLRDATPWLAEFAAIKTDEDVEAIRQCQTVAHPGFAAAREAIHVGATEADIAAATYAALIETGYSVPGAQQVQPHVHVMTGARAALAYRAFNQTSNATVDRKDTVLVQMEVGINGYWAELTRTFFAGGISDEWRRAHQACVFAQDAALHHIRAGAHARNVDDAARQVLQQAGFGSAFKHGLGHGCGFQAINHAAAPVLHPASNAVLRTGMVHNMEPAVYLEGRGGLRLNDTVVVHAEGNEVLSSAIPRNLDWLVVNQ